MPNALDMLARARARRGAPAPPAVAAPPAPAHVPTTADPPPHFDIVTHPPDIPPIMPLPPPRTGIYKGLMHKHDRMGMRHIEDP